MRHWHRLSREAVAAPSLEVSQDRLDMALNNLVQRKVSLPTAGSWNEMFLKLPSNPNHSEIL